MQFISERYEAWGWLFLPFILRTAPAVCVSLPTEEELQKVIPEEYRELTDRNITVFIDPLDGTKEFIKGSDTVPMAMLGICLDHEPIAGILYQPFLEKFTLGIVGSGCFQVKEGNLQPVSLPQSTENITITTSNSHFTDTIKERLQKLKPKQIIREGGAGFKVLSLLEGRASVYCYPSGGTSLWDSCAPEACIIAAGGMLTDCLVRLVVPVLC